MNNRHGFINDMAQEIYKNLDKPHNHNCVTRVANEDMTLQDCHSVALHFQQKGFEATWYQKDDKKPIIVVSWGLPFNIDEIDTMYKTGIQLVHEPYKVVHLLAEYIHYVYLYRELLRHGSVCYTLFPSSCSNLHFHFLQLENTSILTPG